MIINERDLRHQSVVEAAHRMMTAARTAPKAKGVDIIEIALVEEREDLEKAGGGYAPTQRGNWLQIPASRRRQYSSGRGSDTHRHAPSHAGP